MKKAVDGEHWYFVDETGDPVFYDARGNFIVGTEGCSPILALGFIETQNPTAIREALSQLHAQVANDSYLRDIPSISKTNRAFHAKDDAPEVRYLVYQRLAQLDFKAQFIVARKIEGVFRNSFHARESAFYDYLVSKLFMNVLHRHTRNTIYRVDTQFRVLPQVATGEPCLQVIDYMNWAVYRAFTKREMRYLRYVADKVSLLVDFYDAAKYPKNWHSRANPFDIDKASPL